MANAMVALYIDSLARDADDPVLQEMAEALNNANDELEDTNKERVGAKCALIQAKADYDRAWAEALLESTESSKEKREAAALLACRDEADEVTANTITLTQMEEKYDSATNQWKLLRHLIVAKYGSLERYGF